MFTELLWQEDLLAILHILPLLILVLLADGLKLFVKETIFPSY